MGNTTSILPGSLPPSTSITLPWYYLGCYTDSTANRTFKNAFYADSTNMTGLNCVNFCGGKGYNFAGTEYARECFCGLALSGSSNVPSTDCNMNCTGNPSEACGGPNRLTVYQSITGPPTVSPGANGYTLQGCYSDAVGARALANIAQVPGGCRNNSVDACTATCSAGGYIYSGVEYAGECFCGNTIDNGQTSVSGSSPDNGCNYPCRGQLRNYCGGANRINIYQNTANVNLIQNGNFEQGLTPWQTVPHPTLPSNNLVADTSALAQSGQVAYEIRENGADQGSRSLCVQQSVTFPTTGTYNLVFYYGRQSNPATGTTISTDLITMQLYIDTVLYATAPVCNPSTGGCSVNAVNGQKAYDKFTAVLPTTVGSHTVKICAVYSSTVLTGATQDYFLLDNFSLMPQVQVST